MRVVESLEGFVWPTIAVVTRTKGRLGFLKRCIESVQGQTFRAFAHVIYSDGEPVGPIRELITQLDAAGLIPRDSIFVLLGGAQSLGIEGAGNAALQSVHSEYAILLDDDDTWLPDLLMELHAAVSSDCCPNVIGAVCQTAIVREAIKEDGSLQRVGGYPFNPNLTYVLIADLVQGNLFPVHSFLFRTNIWRELGGARSELRALGDWDFNIRYLMKGEIEVVPKLLANWHIRVNASGTQSMTAGGDGPLGLHGRFRVMLRNQYLRDAAAGKMDPQIAMLMQIAQMNSSTRDFMYGQLGLRPLWRKIRSVLGL